MINAVRDVASALAELIYATKSASGKSQNEPAMIHLKDSAKIMVTNVTSLLKTVKTVEDEHARGTRALEATIEALHQEIRVSNFLFICFSRLQQSFLLPGKGGGKLSGSFSATLFLLRY
jgi:hypothetical protein